MTRFARFSSVLTLGVIYCTMATSQTQEPQRYSRVSCMKVKEGKDAEYAAYLRDVVAKLARVRVDAGLFDSYAFQQAVIPAGKSATCDYRLAVVYVGFPPEGASRRELRDPEQVSADLKKAGIAMSREEMLAKRDELATLVGMDIWRFHERVGTAQKGGYSRVNYDKIHPGMTAEWVRRMSTGWKPVAEASSKEHGTAWRAATLVMPGGSGLQYNATTVDHFPTWAQLAKGIDARTIWNKVHPDTDLAAFMNPGFSVFDRTRVDVYRMIELITK